MGKIRKLNGPALCNSSLGSTAVKEKLNGSTSAQKEKNERIKNSMRFIFNNMYNDPGRYDDLLLCERSIYPALPDVQRPWDLPPKLHKVYNHQHTPHLRRTPHATHLQPVPHEKF